MLDGNGASLKVDILYTQSQGFRNSTAKPRQKPYEESVSQASSLFFQLLQLIQVKIGFHSQVAPLISYKVVLPVSSGDQSA
jgi:hypothetical protein